VLSRDNKQVFIVDFGLAKRHLMEDLKTPVAARKKADFRGTVSFASLNAHNNVVSMKLYLILCRTYPDEMTFGAFIS
jgi:hypothetical protein